MLPKGEKPVTNWDDRDKIYAHITRETRKVVDDLLGWNESSKTLHKKHHTEQDDYGPCPYLGVKPYSEYEAHLFFGRETYVNDLLYKLSCDQQLLLVVGPTGSGKTSVIQAGVIPRLRKGGKIIPRSSNWDILTFIPNQSPLSSLLSLLDIQGAENLVEGVKLWKMQHPKKERLVIILDQFEELFRLCQPEEQKDFIAQLFKLIIHDLATIIITMSDAYYSDLAEYIDFMAVAERHISNIPPLQSEEVLEVIEKPAQVVQLYFEEHLAEKIVDDTMRSTQEPKERRRSRHSSVLPLVSVCLQRLWERQQDHYVSLEDYESLGQVSGALTLWATETFHQLSEAQQYLARRIFVDLVALGDDSEGLPDCRRQKTLTQLCYQYDEMQAVREVVEKLARAHLLETQLNEQKELNVNIIHESLLREWNLLRGWLQEDRHFLLWYQEFEHRLHKWRSSHEDVNQSNFSYFLRGRELTEAQQWLAAQPHRFPHIAHEFICASHRQREQEEQQERAQQEIQTRHHITQAKHLATKALLLQEREPRFLRQSLLLAVEALRRHHCVEADQALRQGLTLLPRLHSRLCITTAGQSILFSGNGQNLATAGTQGVSWIAHVGSSDESTEPLSLGKTHAIALSYNGEYLLAGSPTGVTRFIDTVQRKSIAMIQRDIRICCVALTQRPPYIAAVGYENGEIEVHQFIQSNEAETNQAESDLMQRTRLLYILQHNQAISSLSFSHDDRYLVSGGMDRTVRVWSKEGGASLAITDFQSPICSALFSPDATSIAVRSEDGKAFIWQWEQQSRKLWKRWHKHVRKIPQAEHIQMIAFGPGGNCLITASIDGYVRIWKLRDIIEELKLLPVKSPVSSLCYHQGKDWLALACADGTVKIYSIADGLLKYTIPHDAPVTSIAFNAQKPYVATADKNGCVWIWQLQDGNLPGRFYHAGKVMHLHFDQDKNEPVLRLTLDLIDRAELRTLSPDTLLANTVYEYKHISDRDLTGDERQQVYYQENDIMHVFSSDGRSLASITSEGMINVMKIRNPTSAKSLQVTEESEMLTFSHNGEYIAFTNDKDRILLWQWREQNNEPIVLVHTEYVRALAFSQDDASLIVADDNNGVLIWQWKAQIKESYLVLHQENLVESISLSPDQRYFLTLSNEACARVWDRTTGVLTRYLLHKGNVVAATFDSDGIYIATASADTTVGIWDVATGEQLAQLPHAGRVYAVAFSKDGKYLATACDDSMVRLWQWRVSDLEHEAKVRLMGNLTSEEWQEYIGDDLYQETFTDLGWRELSPGDPFDEEEG